MVVIVLSACPVGLRGHLTRWFLEISAGVFVGHVSARVRDLTWVNVCEMVSGGRAMMVFSVPGEQRMDFRVHNHHWTPTDFDGLTLMMRPDPATMPVASMGHPTRDGVPRASVASLDVGRFASLLAANRFQK